MEHVTPYSSPHSDLQKTAEKLVLYRKLWRETAPRIATINRSITPQKSLYGHPGATAGHSTAYFYLHYPARHNPRPESATTGRRKETMREQNKYGVEQLTAEEAIAFGESGIWEHWSLEEIATFQLFQERLCVPFDKFQEAMQQVLGRPVWTHEFADYDRLVGEYWGEKPKPTFEEIISLIPEEKRIIVQM